MEENVKSNDHILSDIWFAIKRHIIVILVIIIISTIGGYVYSQVKKPLYTTSQQVVCTARDEADTDKTNIIANFNIMNAYIGTVVDFSDEGVVIDRANFYYVRYAEEIAKDPTITVDDFIKDIMSIPINQDPYSTQDSNQAQVQNQYILAHNINIISNVKDDTNNEFSFFVKYTDGDKQESQDKARILVLALRRELETEKGTVDSKYFSGIIITIADLGSNGTTSNISEGKSTIIGTTFGVIISMIVCIISVCDKSIKTKEDLEEIAEAPVFACIEYDGGKK
jgi:capsular polysaccharide biosynthesis protein